ncbi:MAG: hypothetical protein EON56_02515 [Alphaproteobacteria bacterium]|nr:MAG: hypothetical protein EON56_02515 [Alphaproteobacteria bacterium]
MTSISCPVYEALAKVISRWGTREVFGLMSDDTALLVTTLDGLGVRFRGTRHETNALAMAEGYASATGEVAIGIIGRGPATANAILGAVQALRSGSRVLLIFADSPNRMAVPNAMGPEQKSFSPAAVLQAAGLRTFTANDATSARNVLAEAWRAAHRGAVALLLPINVQHAMVDVASTDPGVPLAPPAAMQPPRPASVRVAAALLANSTKPLIVAGLGAHPDGPQVPQ